MESTIFMKLKVNNEIALCEVWDLECKEKIEKILLKNCISYFVRWTKPKLFGRKKESCIIYVNENSKETAEKVIRQMGKEIENQIEFIMAKTDNNFL